MDLIPLTVVPVWAWVVVLVGVVGLLGTFVAALPRAARPLAAVALGAWVALTGALAVGGAFVQDVPWIGPTIVVAVALTWLGLRRLGSGVDLVALTAGQTFRVVGGVFFVLWLVGTLPPGFALPAGLGDIAIGLAAPVIARRLRRGDLRGVRAFHVLGIVDLVVAVGTGFLSAPGPLGVLAGGPTTTAALTALPLVLIPTTLVPLSIAVHLHVLGRLPVAGPVGLRS